MGRQKTEVTGRSPLRRRRFAFDSSVIEEKEEEILNSDRVMQLCLVFITKCCFGDNFKAEENLSMWSELK